MAANINNNPPRVVETVVRETTITTAQRCCSWEKTTRVVLRILSTLCYFACGVTIGAFLVGQVSCSPAAWYAGVSWIIGQFLNHGAQRTHDFNDPNELAEIKRTAQHLRFTATSSSISFSTRLFPLLFCERKSTSLSRRLTIKIYPSCASMPGSFARETSSLQKCLRR